MTFYQHCIHYFKLQTDNFVNSQLITLSEDERADSLGKDSKIVVSNDHTFGTDAVLLSSFANIKRRDKAVDLCSGCGVIPLLWRKGGAVDTYAVEIQQKACEQLKKSIELNGFTGNIKVINADLRKLKGILPFGKFDLVSVNPPYKPVGSGIESESEADRIARFETMCTIDDAVEAAAKLLRFGGRFVLCHRPERLADIICSLRAHNLEAKRVRFVSKRHDTEPWLVLVEGRLGGKAGLRVEPLLAMYGEGGVYTDEVKELFKDYIID